MSKTCEICGRIIKTGRKYCFEHRHTVSEYSSTKFDKIEDSYIKYKSIKYAKYGLLIWFISLILLFLLAQFKLFSTDGINGLLLALYVGIGFLFALILGKKVGRENAIDKIVNRDLEYVEFAKSIVQYEREEKEFKKSILK